MDDFEEFLRAMQRDWREIGAELMGLESRANELGVPLLIAKAPNGHWQVLARDKVIAQDELAEFAFKAARERLK